MAQTTIQFDSKRALRDAIAKGMLISIFNPGTTAIKPHNGNFTVEDINGKWDANVTMLDGYIWSIR